MLKGSLADSTMAILPIVECRERIAKAQPALATAVLEGIRKGFSFVKGRRKNRPPWCPRKQAEKALPKGLGEKTRLSQPERKCSCCSARENHSCVRGGRAGGGWQIGVLS